MLNFSKPTANKFSQPIGWIEKIRRFVDGDNDEIELETALSESPQPRLPARELFYKQLVHQLDQILHEERFGPPNVPLTVPSEIVIHVASDVNAMWQNQYRRRLLDGLDNVVRQRVREMAGTGANRTVPPQITLREDPSLDLGDIRLEARYGESGMAAFTNSSDPEATIVYLEPNEGEPTIVITPEVPLYELAMFHHGCPDRRLPVSKPKAIIGRGSKAKPADITLSDPGVSREHAVLDFENGKLWLTALGKNGTTCGGRPLERRHRRQVHKGESIAICGFTLEVTELTDASKRN